MFVRTVLGLCTALLIFSSFGKAGGKEDLQKYFNDAATRVKATSDPSEKREILSTSFEKMSKALDVARNSSMVSEEEKAGIDLFRTSIVEKQHELIGQNGFDRVPDAKLDAFADYAVQDTEQAAEYVTISVVTLLLIIILIILIVK
ncbi:MAG: hypothetical protein ABI623_00355 [bacterium]